MATVAKPADLGEYREWLSNERNAEVTKAVEGHYEAATTLIQSQFEDLPVWREILESLSTWDESYRLAHGGYALLGSVATPSVGSKDFQSFLSKTYRWNVVKNERWPEPPVSQWVVFPDWYSQINDIVRTSLTAKYLDGVTYLVDKVKEVAAKHKIPSRDYFQATTDGYYAAHVYLRPTFSLPDITFAIRAIPVEIEIQITTQLQDVIKLLIHRYYAEHRETHDFADVTWQWDQTTDEFATNYLGHILHYVEGMIVEVRDKQIIAGKTPIHQI